MKIDRYITTSDSAHKRNATSKNVAALKQGDKFKATILDIKRNEVVIKLSDGSILTAKSLVLPQAHIGDTMEFIVQSNLDGQVLLNMIAGDIKQQQSNLLSNLLLSANIMPSEEAVNVVKMLMDNELPIDKTSIDEAIQMLKRNPKLDMDTLAFLLKEDIPVSAKNIDQIEQLIGHGNKIMNQIDHLSWKLVAIDEADVKEQILQIFLPETTLEAQKQPSASLKQYAVMNLENIVLKLESENQKQMFSAAVQCVINDDELMYSVIESLKNGEDIKTMIDTMVSKYPDNVQLLSTLKDEQLLPLFVEYLEKLIETQQVKPEIKPEALSKAIMESLFIEIKNEDMNEDLNAYYNKLYEKISKAIDITKVSDSINTREANVMLNDIKDNIDFMNQINKFQEYIQIPFKFNDKNNQGELYIFNDKKGKKISKDKASVLLALDLKMLGHFEAFIQKDYNDISCQFRTMDKKIQSLLQISMPKLESALKQKGYHLSQIFYKTIEEPFNILQKIDDVGMDTKGQTSQPKRYSFDMRA